MEQTLKGRVQEIIFRNDENGYTVARFQGEKLGQTTVTGVMPSVNEGDVVQLEGQWKEHEIYGRQFQVSGFSHSEIDTREGAIAYLSSGAIVGVGLKMAMRIVDCFGGKAIEVLEHDPQAYLKVEGIGKKKLKDIVESHNKGRELRKVISMLVPHGISPAYCMRIYNKYKEETIAKITQNPYGLCRDIKGIGFKRADEIAHKLQTGLDSKERIEQGLLYLLQEATMEGHTYLELSQLVKRAMSLLGCDEDTVKESVYDLAVTDELVLEHMENEQRVYLYRYNVAETAVASKLIRLACEETTWVDSGEEAQQIVDDLQVRHRIRLSNEQLSVAVEALMSKVLIVTGGPGTGKTTTLSFLLEVMKEKNKKVVLCAPTGRAAKRMTESTGKSALTIHRLLEAGVSGDEGFMIFQKDEEDPIAADVIIIDEISMVDILLFHHFLRAVSPGTTLILVGDKDQLPSVGAGSVFKDLLDSQVIKTIRLNEIFRQAQESLIVVNAHRINAGQMPQYNQEGKDFFFMERKIPAEIASLVVDLVRTRLKNYYGFESKDIQVLSPMRKSETGVLRLNELLQEALNPPQIGKREHKTAGRILRTGDRIMHIKNNYEKNWKHEESGMSGEGIFNGDIGYIDFIETREKKLYVTFDDGKRVEYDFTELDEIEHAFATTVHKSQGSEFPCVVLPIFAMPPMLMSRKILYTAITRAKQIVVIVGYRKYLSDMVSNIYEEERNTALCQKLRLFVEDQIILEEAEDGMDIPF